MRGWGEKERKGEREWVQLEAGELTYSKFMAWRERGIWRFKGVNWEGMGGLV